MNRISQNAGGKRLVKLALCLLLFAACSVRADQLEMVNGDHYFGKIVSLNSNTIVWKSEILGTLTLSRDKVANISLGSSTVASATRPAARTNLQAKTASLTSASTNLQGATSLSQLRSNSNLIHQVEAQFLSDADPAAKAKYNELMGGLLTGKLNIGDIRAEAKSASDQIRSLKKETGDSTGLLDGYLEILDKFVAEAESEASSPSTTNRSLLTPKPAP